MHQEHAIRHVVRTIYDHAESGTRALIERVMAHTWLPATQHAGPPLDAEPTLYDLDMAGAEWTPISDTHEDGYEIARDNGYVLLRTDDPDGPIQLILEDDWDAYTRGDLDIDLP